MNYSFNCNLFVKLLLIIVSIILLNACNTMEGIGRDIKQGGNAIERAASKNSNQKTQQEPTVNNFNNNQNKTD